MALVALAGADGLASVGLDNRVTLWDSTSGKAKQTLRCRGQLGAVFSALGFGRSEAEAVVVVGDAKGCVTAWDAVRGEALLENAQVPGWTSAEAVSDLVLTRDCSSVLCSSEHSKYVVEVELKSGKALRKLKVGKHGCSKLCVSEDGKLLLTAGSTIKLWDLRSGKKLARFAGHSTPVRTLCFAPDNKHFLSACEDRSVNVWAFKRPKGAVADDADDADAKIPFHRAPDRVLSAPSAPRWMGCSAKASGKRFTVCAAGESGDAYLWALGEGAAQDAQPHCTLSNSDNKEGAVQAVFFRAAKGKAPEEVLLVRNSALRPIFEEARIGEDQELKAKVVLQSVTAAGRLMRDGGSVEATAEDAAADEDEKTDTGAEMDVDEGTKKPDAKRLATVAKEKLHIVPTSSLAAPKKAADDDGDEAEPSEDGEEALTMGERVKALNDKLSTMVAEKALETEDMYGRSGKKRPREEKTSAVSLSTVLEQALQSNDDKLLEVCMRNSEAKVVKATVARLSRARVLRFLQVIVDKFQSKPARGANLIVWIRAILEHHAAFLIKSPNLAGSLSGLYQIVETRINGFSKILKLQGRLEFVMSQVALRADQAERVKKAKKRPSLVYDEEAPIQNDDEDEDESESSDEEMDDDDANDESKASAEEESGSEEEEEEEETKPKRARKSPQSASKPQQNGTKEHEEASDESDGSSSEEEEEKAAPRTRATRSAVKAKKEEAEEEEDDDDDEEEEEEEAAPKTRAARSAVKAKKKKEVAEEEEEEDASSSASSSASSGEEEEQEEEQPKGPKTRRGKQTEEPEAPAPARATRSRRRANSDVQRSEEATNSPAKRRPLASARAARTRRRV